MKVTATEFVQLNDKCVFFAGQAASFLWSAGRRR
jgi:hypothetical protein